jgi:hypothetical protein
MRRAGSRERASQSTVDRNSKIYGMYLAKGSSMKTTEENNKKLSWKRSTHCLISVTMRRPNVIGHLQEPTARRPNGPSAIPAAGRKLPSAPKTRWSQFQKEDPLPNRTAWPQPFRTARHPSREARLRAASFLLSVRRSNLISKFLRSHCVST